MPSPSTQLATPRTDLGSLLEFDLSADRAGFIGHRVLPVLDVQQQAGSFGKIPLEQLLMPRDTKRAPGAGYSRSKFTFTEASYSTEEHGAEEPVDDREVKLYQSYFDAEAIAAQRALDVVLRNAEKRIADLVFNATTWTGAEHTTAVTNEWTQTHKTDAVPVNDVNSAKNKVFDLTGIWPNALIITRKVFQNLRVLDQIKDAIAAAGAGYPTRASDVTVEQLAAVFDLDFILVAASARNTATEGQTRSISEVWTSDYAMVCRVATSQDMREPCIGRTFHWGADGSQIGGTVESYREEAVRGDIIRIRHEVDELILYHELGHLLSNVYTD